jgi:DNA-directed RNA polymerase specialized sigma24 family protein
MRGELTLQADRRTVQDAPGSPAQPGLAAGPAAPPAREWPGRGDPALRHGFTYGNLEALAWAAVRYHTPSRGLDTSDRFEAAWGAVAECLYAAAEPPTPLGLVHAGLAGLDRLRKGGLRERGRGGRNRDGRDAVAWPASAGSFYRYWTRPAPPTPEETAVEATAVRQVLAALGPAYGEALAALAEHGDYQAAAAALELSQTAFNARVRRGREAFLALWHEHEAVPGRWRTDRRLYRRAPRSGPAGPADAATSLRSVLAIVGRPPNASWMPADLGEFLRSHGIDRHRVPVDGDHRKRVGYRLGDITRALRELTAPAALEGHAA